MPFADVHRAPLTVHPSTPCDTVRSLEVSVRIRKPGVLVLDYFLDADTSRLRIPGISPAAGAARRADELWKHTCFEAFVAPGTPPGYLELNFSPSTQWAAYRFSSYRAGVAPAANVALPEISVDLSQRSLRLKSTMALGDLAALPGGSTLRVALAAVIEQEDGRLSYWSLRHAAGKPDFHHHDGFALEITT